MKVTWSDLSLEERLNFGNGCSRVPDFIFTASCRQHDFNYSRGGYLRAKIKADYDLCVRMFDDAFSHQFWYVYMWIGVIYFLGLSFLPFSYLRFTWGRWRSKEEVLAYDMMMKK